MKLSTRTQYGLRMLCQLAMEYDRGPVQMGEIVKREGISEKYLGQIMLALRSSGLVASLRGAQGGYYLSRTPDSITLLEVVEFLEGSLLDFEEAVNSQRDDGDRISMLNATHGIWKRVRDAIRDLLVTYTLEDVVRLGLYTEGFLDYRI